MRSKMKPCPFCGETLTNMCKTRYLDEEAYAVTCRTRSCHGAIFSLGYGLFPTERAAITAWNRRPLTPSTNSPDVMEIDRGAI